MEFRNLQLRNGLRFASRLCFGCEPLGGIDWGEVDVDEIKRALEVSIELGWNFIDTAAVYGLGTSERHVGEVTQVNSRRALVATKIGITQTGPVSLDGRAKLIRTLNPVLLENQIRSSLERLNTNYLPLVYLHYPDLNCNHLELTQTIGSWINSGLVGGYGLSNFNLDEIKRFHDLLPVSAVQFECSMLDSERHGEVRQKVEWCKENGVLSVAYGVLKKGLLSGKYGLQEPKFSQNDRRSRLNIFKGKDYKQYMDQIKRIKQCMRYNNYSLSALGIRYILDALDVDIAIIGIKSIAQVIANHQSCSFRLHENEIMALTKALEG